MAIIGICHRGQSRNTSRNTGWTLCQIPGWKRENGTEGRNEGKSAAYDTESNPAISCTPSQLGSALSIYGYGICMKGKPGLMDQDWCWNSFCMNFWENVWLHSSGLGNYLQFS